jgi:hypothetical protein
MYTFILLRERLFVSKLKINKQNPVDYVNSSSFHQAINKKYIFKKQTLAAGHDGSC